MKPKPFWLLNHFTVPVAMCVVCFQRQYDWRAREHCRFNIGFWEKVVSKAAFAPEANSFGRNSITPFYIVILSNLARWPRTAISIVELHCQYVQEGSTSPLDKCQAL